MDLSPSSSEYQQCPLQFYDFKHLDHSKYCSLYSTVCNSGKTISFDDLEALHTDLSKLKDAVQNRIQLLSSELTILGEWQVRRKRKQSDSDPVVIKGGQKVATVTADNKRSKSSQRNIMDDQAPPPPKKIKGKSKGNEVDTNIIGSALTKSKTEGADKFWTSLEPYFTDITDTDLHSLQSHDNSFDKSLFDVPPLGQHYSTQWAIEDIKEEGNETNKFLKKQTSWQDEAFHLLTESTPTTKPQEQYGPLTQKLIATFLDTPNGSSNIKSILPHKVNSICNEMTPSVLEKRLKEELTLLGIIEPVEVQDSSDEDDEIVRELKKAQAELKVVHEYNIQQKNMLHSLAKSEMRRQDIRKQLQETDQEIMYWLKHFATYRQKKKKEPIKQKDKETAQKCIEKRQKLVHHLLV